MLRRLRFVEITSLKMLLKRLSVKTPTLASNGKSSLLMRTIKWRMELMGEVYLKSSSLC